MPVELAAVRSGGLSTTTVAAASPPSHRAANSGALPQSTEHACCAASTAPRRRPAGGPCQSRSESPAGERGTQHGDSVQAGGPAGAGAGAGATGGGRVAARAPAAPPVGHTPTPGPPCWCQFSWSAPPPPPPVLGVAESSPERRVDGVDWHGRESTRGGTSGLARRGSANSQTGQRRPARFAPATERPTHTWPPTGMYLRNGIATCDIDTDTI